jgi:hypothetical protein
MITPVHTNLTRTTARVTAPVKNRAAAPKQRDAGFDKLLQANRRAAAVTSNAAPVSSAAVPSSAAANGVKWLGPFASNTILGPSEPVARVTPSPNAQPAAVSDPLVAANEVSGIPSGLINFTNRTMHEQTMNSWLEKSTQSSNSQKMQIYSQAMVNWKLNETRYRDLGLPVPPQPQPPALDAVQPMPNGWWYEDTRA